MNETKNIAKREDRSEALQTESIDPGVSFSPQVDVIEKKDCIQILADMPGVCRDNVEATLEEGVLTIAGKVSPCDEGGMSLESAEYESGNFHRSFAVGEGLDTEGIEAAMQDGVLKLSVPKSDQYKPRRIEIK